MNMMFNFPMDRCPFCFSILETKGPNKECINRPSCNSKYRIHSFTEEISFYEFFIREYYALSYLPSKIGISNVSSIYLAKNLLDGPIITIKPMIDFDFSDINSLYDKVKMIVAFT